MIDTSRSLLTPAFYMARVEDAEYVRGDVQKSPATGGSRSSELSLNLTARVFMNDDDGPLLIIAARLRNTRNRGSRYSQLLKALGIPYTPPGELDPAVLTGKLLYVRVEHAIHPALGIHLIAAEMHPVPVGTTVPSIAATLS